jgi:transposase InsO family protein
MATSPASESRASSPTVPIPRLRSFVAVTPHPDHVWALDYQFDVTATGRIIKILHVVDEFTRESLTDLVDHSIDADATVAALEKIIAQRRRHPSSPRTPCGTGAASQARVPARPPRRRAGLGCAQVERCALTDRM